MQEAIAEPVADPAVESSAVAEIEAAVLETDGRRAGFEVHLANFEGPFDLLLGLISKHKLDVTEVSLSKVTDEFIAYISGAQRLGSEAGVTAGAPWDLAQATEFLVVAATLLDLKAARLLPAASIEDEEDLALLEARDLLFARLLQYRAYKQVAAQLQEWHRAQSLRFPRAVSLEPRYADALPEVLLGVGAAEFARIAAHALAPKLPPMVNIDHLHNVQVSVREHARILRDRLSQSGAATFRSLVADCEHTLEVIARFLAVLELFREGVVAFDQATPLGDLHIRWTGSAEQSDTDSDQKMDEEYG
jgi:segregation and condensation protein A